MAVTVTQLRSFLAVVRTGSVTAAAEELVVSQPSVSAAVSALTRELGVELTERVGRNVRPSPAGNAFASYAADIIGLLDQGARAAREAADATATELRIGAVTTAGEHIVPQLMQAFAARHPEVALNVDVGNRERVFERLRTHRSDVAIGGRPPDDGTGRIGRHAARRRRTPRARRGRHRAHPRRHSPQLSGAGRKTQYVRPAEDSCFVEGGLK